MKILALYPFLPFPINSGAAMRGYAVLDFLAAAHQVTLASFVGKEDSPSEFQRSTAYSRLAEEPILIPRQTEEDLTAKGSRLRESRPKSPIGLPQALSFFDSSAMWNRIAELDLTQFDAVHARFITMTPYALAVKRHRPCVIAVDDLDDNPTLLAYRKFQSLCKAKELRTIAWHCRDFLRTFAYEVQHLRKFDSIWVCSRIDQRRVSRRLGSTRTFIIGNAVDATALGSLSRGTIERAILMIADFNYSPNSDGALFFIGGAWPLIRAAVPDAQLWLVGKNNRSELLALNGKQGITVTGMVSDVTCYLSAASIAIAPLFVGTGTKLKILEALAAGLPVVTTRVGVEGIEAIHGVHILLANSGLEFAKHCIALLQDPLLRNRISTAGQALIREKYDFAVMNDQVIECYRGLAGC